MGKRMVSTGRAIDFCRERCAAGWGRARSAALSIQQALFWLRTTKFVRRFSWRRLFNFAGLAILIGFLGLIVGGLVVLFPPMMSIGVLGIPLLLLIWATPELRSVPTQLMTKAFYAYVFVFASIPYYYAVQIPGLPWLTVRRLFVFSLLLFFGIAVAGSPPMRQRILATLKTNKPLYTCIVGYCGMCVASIVTARNVAFSISQFSEFTFNWFVPACVCLYIVRTVDDVRWLLKLVCVCFFLDTALGVLDFIGQHNYAIDLIPRFIFNKMMADYPAFADIVNSNYMRNGYYRASSVFVEPLSYGEFAALAAPLAAYFIFHGESPFERVFGALIMICVLTSLFVSGARGGSVAFIASMPIFLALWVVRYARANPFSMVGPLGGALAFMATSSLIGLVLSVGRLRKMVLGGGESASSDMSRFDQAKLAWPKILANPVTGHGIGNAAEVIGFHSPGGKLSVDTSILTLLVETGVPGFLLFVGILVVGFYTMARLYICNTDRTSALGAAFASSFLAYGVYRLVLSQRENQWLVFILLALACVVLKIAADQGKQEEAAGVARTAAGPGAARQFHAAAHVRSSAG